MTATEPRRVPPQLLREDRVSYTPTAHSVTMARQRAARLVGQWGHPLSAADAGLLVSELTTNALLHGAVRGRLIRVHLMLTAALLRIEVTDPRGERLPHLRRIAPDDPYGRGLIIVDRIADDWGVEQCTVGKAVFAELNLRRNLPAPV
ncbi:ATP-binding protein [uncultured Streptomyces sp.]|uniref:ATP-binding protein n=1 Tax=uncultured Streptomyces sp. TaxID=174707 RepID=UPI002618274A|nr:ATP-binding protein [uncultured Streptomyces sp.]